MQLQNSIPVTTGDRSVPVRSSNNSPFLAFLGVLFGRKLVRFVDGFQRQSLCGLVRSGWPRRRRRLVFRVSFLGRGCATWLAALPHGFGRGRLSVHQV